MIAEDFIKYIKPYPDYKIVSDSGWECNATEIDLAIISHEKKLIILKQDWMFSYEFEHYNDVYETKFELLYGLVKKWGA